MILANYDSTIQSFIIAHPLSFSTITKSVYDLESWISGFPQPPTPAHFQKGIQAHKQFYQQLAASPASSEIAAPSTIPEPAPVDIKDIHHISDWEIEVKHNAYYDDVPFVFIPDMYSPSYNLIIDVKSYNHHLFYQHWQLWLYAHLLQLPNPKYGIIYMKDGENTYIPVDIPPRLAMLYTHLTDSYIISTLDYIAAYLAAAGVADIPEDIQESQKDILPESSKILDLSQLTRSMIDILGIRSWGFK